MAAAVYQAIKVAIIGSCEGQQIVNIFHVDPNADVQGATEGVSAAYIENYKPILSGSYEFVVANGMDMRSADGGTFTVPLTGEETGGGLSTQEVGLAAIVRWSDTVTGRAYRACRTYLGPLPGTDFTRSGLELTAQARVAIQAASSSFLSDVLTNVGSPLVVVHGVAGPNTPLVSTVTGVGVATNSAHLDSRRK